ncbi:hypothetical protein ACFSX9_15795 [Flavobacterium ardleyense]|uniref:Uncharacterized protein n=1 Tax=Flavobacterium ardleyense TaxID=2038737 RepID=A0ABW5ZE14_9FLAO
MKKKYFLLNHNLSNILTRFLLLLCTLSFVHATAQVSVNDTYYKVISHGDKIDFGAIEKGVKWVVSSAEAQVSSIYLSENEINNFVFAKPGIYQISFQETYKHSNNECSHPQFKERMAIKVSPIKMTFDFSKISFSEKIRIGSNCDQIIVTVPVNIVIKDLQSTKFNVANLIVAGVGAEIIGKPVIAEVVLKNGTQLLKYQLSGVASNEAYLMFDFVDYNGNIQTYYQPEIVN